MLLFAKQHEMWRAPQAGSSKHAMRVGRLVLQPVDELIIGENDLKPTSCLVCVRCRRHSI